VVTVAKADAGIAHMDIIRTQIKETNFLDLYFKTYRISIADSYHRADIRYP